MALVYTQKPRVVFFSVFLELLKPESIVSTERVFKIYNQPMIISLTILSISSLVIVLVSLIFN